MAGKTVPEGVGGCPLNRFLDMGFMQVIPPVFICFSNKGQGLSRKKPLPYQLFGSIFILLFKPVRHKNTGITAFQIGLMQFNHLIHLILQGITDGFRKGNRSVLFARTTPSIFPNSFLSTCLKKTIMR
jgi:hypothetical protein